MATAETATNRTCAMRLELGGGMLSGQLAYEQTCKHKVSGGTSYLSVLCQ